MRQIQGKPTKAGWSVGLLSVIPLWLRHLPQRGRHPLSRKLDASPLPGRPRPVRRLEEADDHGRKPWYCRQKRAGRAHTKRHKADSSFSLKTGFVIFYKSIIHFLLHIVNNSKKICPALRLWLGNQSVGNSFRNSRLPVKSKRLLTIMRAFSGKCG